MNPRVGPGALAELFADLFTEDELRRFLHDLPDGDLLVRALPTRRPLSEIAYEAAELLRRNGRVDAALFRALIRSRPTQGPRIAALAQTYEVRLESPGTASAPRPAPVGEPSAGSRGLGGRRYASTFDEDETAFLRGDEGSTPPPDPGPSAPPVEAQPAADAANLESMILGAPPPAEPAEPTEPAESPEPVLPPPLVTDPRAPLVTRYANEDEDVDRLGIGDEIEAMARTVLARSVRPPLSIGLFGDWGAGKSFFMRQLQERVRSFAEQVGTAPARAEHWHADVAQIRFNAWHYSDAELWPSLINHLFERLFAAMEVAKIPNPREGLLQKLSLAKAAADEAEALRQRCERERADAARALDEAGDLRRKRADDLKSYRARDVWALVKDEPELKAVIESLRAEAAALGLPGLLVEGDRLRADLDSLRASGAQLRAILHDLANKPGAGPRMVGLLILVVGVPLAASALPALLVAFQASAARAELAALIVQVSAVVGGIGLAARRAVQVAATTTETLTRRIGQVDAIIRAKQEERDAEELRLEAELRAAEARETEAIRRFEDSRQRLAEAESALHASQADRLMRDFVASRAQSADYQARKGLISLVQADFEQLREHLDQVALEAESRAPEVRRITRIVLYIDDLDRCRPKQVVEVLQAVHLMLAFELFVVVVAVDTRWLVRALEKEYQGFLRSPDEPAGAGDEGAATPHDYLEKIFQVPFHIRPIDARGFADLIDGLCPPLPGAPPPVAAADASGAATTTDAETQAGASVALAPPPAPSVLHVTDEERAFMKRLHRLVESPRAAKRLVNVYHLLRTMGELRRRSAGGPSGAGAAPTVGDELLRAILLMLAFQGSDGRHAAELGALLMRGGARTWADALDGLRPRARVELSDGQVVAVPMNGDGWRVQRTGRVLVHPSGQTPARVTGVFNDASEALSPRDQEVWERFVAVASGLEPALLPATCAGWTDAVRITSRFSFYPAPIW